MDIDTNLRIIIVVRIKFIDLHEMIIMINLVIVKF